MYLQTDDAQLPPPATPSTDTAPKALFAHQQRGLDRVVDAVSSGKKRVMLQAPCAYGKTVVMAELIKRAMAKGKRVIVTVPKLQLIPQTVERLAEWGVTDVGIFQGATPTHYGRQVQICSVQTLESRYRRGQMFPKGHVVFIDEAHRWFEFFGKWMADPAWAKTRWVGLSATPWTKGLGRHYDGLVIGATIQELINAGHLSDFRVYAASHPDLAGVKDVAGDYNEGQLSTAMQKPTLVADAVEAYEKHGEGRKGLYFAVDRAHGAKLQDQFNKAGIPAGYIDANTPMAERKKIELALKHGRLKVVINIACLTEGCDWPFVDLIGLCRPTKSEMLYVQIIGRGLRKWLGKRWCLILDHSDTTKRLGFVTDVHHDTLDDGKHRIKKAAKREKRETPAECLSCGALRRPQQKKCWSCGYEGKRQTKVQHAEGELKELTRGKQLKFSMEDKQRFWSGALHWGYQRGKSRDTMAGYYKRHFGVWPKGLRELAMEDPETSALCTKSAQDFARRKSYGSRRNTPANAGVSP